MSASRCGATEPLRCFISGAAGTGKSQVGKDIRELFKRLGWTQGENGQYQFVSLQATTAEVYAGDTIHHAFGLRQNFTKHDLRDVQPRVDTYSCRWLIIDEISLVPPDLLATVEQLLREPRCTGFNNAWATGEGECAGLRPWAGLNVIFLGDFVQLDPPRSSRTLSDPPSGFLCDAIVDDSLVDHGIQLLWEQTTTLVELTQQCRIDDQWYLNVTTDCRYGDLQDDDYHFLLGRPTAVAGSYLRRAAGKPFPHLACGEAACEAYGETHVECRACDRERWRRRVLKRDTGDPRVGGRFKKAVTLCDTNDVRCDIAAQRARLEAAENNARLRFIAAEDSAVTDDNRYGTRPQRQADKVPAHPHPPPGCV